MPSLIFTVIGTLDTSTQLSTIPTNSSGLPIKAAPAQWRVTFGAGQPKFRSIKSAFSCNNSQHFTISSTLPPKIWGMKGSSRGSLSNLCQLFASWRVKAAAAVNSEMVKSAPHSLANSLNARSVTPAIGARKRGTCSTSAPIFVSRGRSDTEVSGSFAPKLR